jgi:hypothetical protein
LELSATYLLCNLNKSYNSLCHSQDFTGEAAQEAQKHLTFYELDLGLNHVVRKWTEPVDNGANMLLTVPGGADGPSGVLVCDCDQPTFVPYFWSLFHLTLRQFAPGVFALYDTLFACYAVYLSSLSILLRVHWP